MESKDNKVVQSGKIMGALATEMVRYDGPLTYEELQKTVKEDFAAMDKDN